MGDLEEGEVREDILCPAQISSANRELMKVDEHLHQHVIQLRKKQVELITLNKRILDDLHRLKEGAFSKKKEDTEILEDEIGTSLASFTQEFERKSTEWERLYNFVEESSLLTEQRQIELWKLMKDHNRAVDYLLPPNRLQYQEFPQPTLHEEIDAGSASGTETTSEEQ